MKQIVPKDVPVAAIYSYINAFHISCHNSCEPLCWLLVSMKSSLRGFYFSSSDTSLLKLPPAHEKTQLFLGIFFSSSLWAMHYLSVLATSFILNIQRFTHICLLLSPLTPKLFFSRVSSIRYTVQTFYFIPSVWDYSCSAVKMT